MTIAYPWALLKGLGNVVCKKGKAVDRLLAAGMTSLHVHCKPCKYTGMYTCCLLVWDTISERSQMWNMAAIS